MDTKALRQKILDLAIRGKLVPQDPNDEPASVLLERIREQKQQMVKDGKLKKKDIKNDSVIFVGEDNLHYEKFADGSVKCIEDEIPFELPEGWAWARISTIALFWGGYAYKSSKYIPDSQNILIRIGNIKNNNINPLIAKTCISDEYAAETNSYLVRENDILFTMTGTRGKRDYFYSCRIKKSDLEGRQLFLNQRVGCLRLVSVTDILPSYFVNTIQSSYVLDAIFATETGNVNQGNIGSTATLNLLIPVAPTEEQYKIQEKSLSILSAIKQFDIDTEDLSKIINKLRIKILDLAIHGKLVPQNPNDEPASVLLERIRAEKEELIKQGKLKRDRKESVIFKGEDNSYYEKIGSEVRCIDEEITFDIPNTWEWIRLENCCSKEIRRGKSPKYIDESGTLVFAQKCNTKYNGIDIGLALYLDESTLGRYPTDEYMQDGDIVVNSTGTGTLGRVGFYRTSDNHIGLPIVPDSHITIIRGFSCIRAFYLYTFMKAKQGILEKKGEGSTNQKELKPLTLKEMLVPVPPISEQKRIETAFSAAFSIITSIERGLS